MYPRLGFLGAEEVSSANQCDLLFISLDWSRSKDLRTPLSAASIEAYFRENQAGNVKAEFKNFNLNSPDFDVRDVRKSIKERRPNFLALGAYIWNEQYVPDVVRWTKEHYSDTVIILGGPQATYGNHYLVTEYPGVDYFIRGEGEEPFTELVNVLSIGDVPNPSLLDRYAIYTRGSLKQGKCNRIFTTEPDKLVSPYLSHILPVKKIRNLFVGKRYVGVHTNVLSVSSVWKDTNRLKSLMSDSFKSLRISRRKTFEKSTSLILYSTSSLSIT